MLDDGGLIGCVLLQVLAALVACVVVAAGCGGKQAPRPPATLPSSQPSSQPAYQPQYIQPAAQLTPRMAMATTPRGVTLSADRQSVNIHVSALIKGKCAIKAYDNTYLRGWQGPTGDGPWRLDRAPHCSDDLEHFYVYEARPGFVTLSHGFGVGATIRVLRAHPDGYVDYIVTNPDKSVFWVPILNADGTWSFKHLTTKRFLSAHLEGLMCTMPHNLAAERFSLLALILLFALLSALLRGSPDDNDSGLPVYLRGIGWRNVEAELRKDLRLSPNVLPINYDLSLQVDVRGYGNAKKSTYNGTVSISLNITAPVREIELHSQELTIREAKLLGINYNGEWETLNNDEFQVRKDRETVAIPSRRLILPGEKVSVEIIYNGTARMDGGGFYESWNQRENSTDLPYISLLTHCEPSRARRWFPCFDEPDKKATFHLTVTHPTETNAYSNTNIRHVFTHNGTRVTEFESTVPLPTYLVALAITEQPVVELTVDGYELRAIGYNREKAVRTAAEGLAKLRNHSMFKGVPFFPQKMDILVVDDYRSMAMENPGLITIDFEHSESLSMHVHELAHMYFGNLVTLSTWGDIWLNEGFAALFEKDLKPSGGLGKRSEDLLSIRDIAMHSDENYYSSIYLYNSFGTHIQHIHYNRASQFIRMIRKFVGADVFDRAINNYLLENAYGNGDATKLINILLNEYDGDDDQLKKILYEWLYQPGVAILFMSRDEDEVVLRQTRFTSSFFNEELRDEHTRFTIPLFCEIDGKKQTFVFNSEMDNLTIPLSRNSTFTIENDYGDLFGIWAELDDLPTQNIEDWLLLTVNLVRSGLLATQQFSHSVSPLADNPEMRKFLQNHISRAKEVNNVWDQRAIQCEGKGKGVLDAPFSELFAKYLRENDLSILFCSEEAKDREATKELLHAKIITDELKIRSIQLEEVVKSIEHLHPGATMDFVMEELLRDPTSLPLRHKLEQIITAVYTGNSSNLDVLHEFIRRHPSIAAENYDALLQTLEKSYLLKEFEMRNREMETIMTIY